MTIPATSPPPDHHDARGPAVPPRMLAVVQREYGPPESLAVDEVPTPTPSPDQVLVEVRAAGVDPSVWHLLAGEPRLVRLFGGGLRRPKRLVPGFDVAGRVVAVGADVAGVVPGDEVFGATSGAFARYAVLREDRCVRRPEGVSAEEAAAVGVSGVTALQAVHGQAGVTAGQRVLVLGAAGGVGTFAVQLAAAAGAEVTGACSAGKADLVRSLGAAHAIDYRRRNPVDGTERYDVVIDLAGLRPLRALRRALTPEGTLVIVGGEGGGVWFGGLGRNLRASLMSPFVGQRLRWLVATTRGRDLRTLADLLADGSLRVAVDRAFPLAEAAAAVRYVQDGHAAGKVVLTV